MRRRDPPDLHLASLRRRLRVALARLEGVPTLNLRSIFEIEGGSVAKHLDVQQKAELRRMLSTLLVALGGAP